MEVPPVAFSICLYWYRSTVTSSSHKKVSYRKDDRVMRPIYGALKIFKESLNTPTTFPEIFNGLLFRSML